MRFIRLYLCVIFFGSTIFSQMNQPISRNDKVEACTKKHFVPVMMLDSQSEKDFRYVGCSEPNPLLCDISYGISQRNYEGVKCLVEADYDFNVPSGKYALKEIPIMSAALYDVEILRLIVESKTSVDINVKDKSGRNALQNLTSLLQSGLINRGRNFSWERVYKSVELLLEKGADPNDSFDGLTPLMSKSRTSGAGKYVALLLRYNANPDLQSSEGETAIMMSADDPEIIKLLLEANSNIYLKDKNGNSAIFHAVEKCQINKVEALIKRDENILTSVNNEGMTALNYLKKQTLSAKCPKLKYLSN